MSEKEIAKFQQWSQDFLLKFYKSFTVKNYKPSSNYRQGDLSILTNYSYDKVKYFYFNLWRNIFHLVFHEFYEVPKSIQ